MNMATIDNRLVLYEGIHYMLNDDGELYVANIEFTNWRLLIMMVRDKIWHKRLKYVVIVKIIDDIRYMYENIKSMVKYDNRLSNDVICL